MWYQTAASKILSIFGKFMTSKEGRTIASTAVKNLIPEVPSEIHEN
jgi:hypothetical protein